MKRFLSLLLCLVLACAMLVSCGDETIGDGISEYPRDVETSERLELNMYIVMGEGTKSAAIDAVSTRISGYTKTNYNTVLNIHYVSAEDYESTVITATTSASAPNIVLITSKSMFDTLRSQNKIADLTDYYSSRDFGKLNTQIATSLLDASRIDGKLYTVPNNHIVGEYEYLVINKEIARDTLKYTNSELSSYKSLEDAAELIAEMNQNGYNADEYVKVVKGSYELKEELSELNFCNVISVPTATVDDAFSSAFAIINNVETKYNDRAMEIIYAINTDTELRDFLQYGVYGANYNIVDGNIVRVKEGDNIYNMSLLYTGDVFKASYCSELDWIQSVYDYGILQNKDSVAAKADSE